MLWDPIHWHESCPSSDGACAMVMTHGGPRRGVYLHPPPAGVGASPQAIQLPSWGMFPGRDPVAQAGGRCADGVFKKGRRITNPRRADRLRGGSTSRSRGTSRCGSRATTSPGRARGGSRSSRGDTEIGGNFPVNLLGRCALVATRSGPSGCCAASRPRTRCGARRASTRSTAEDRPGHGVWRQLAVLQHVGGGQQPPALRLIGPFQTVLADISVHVHARCQPEWEGERIGGPLPQLPLARLRPRRCGARSTPMRAARRSPVATSGLRRCPSAPSSAAGRGRCPPVPWPGGSRSGSGGPPELLSRR